MKNYSFDNKMFIAGLFAPVAAVLIYFLAINMARSSVYICPIHSYTGYYCPGCGGTRSFSALMQGHIFESLYYFPAIPYCVVIYIVYMITNALRIITKGKIKSLMYSDKYIWIALILLIVNCLIKNLYKLITGISPMA